MPDGIERDIDYVIITGAGASREFGKGSKPKLPLMSDWSDQLLNKVTKNLTLGEWIGLTKNMSGPEFEQKLGEFLRASANFPNIKNLLKVSGKVSKCNEDDLKQFLNDTELKLKLVNQGIVQTLYENFNQNVIEISNAKDCYEELLVSLGLYASENKLADKKVVFATTNYDKILEYALEKLDIVVDRGEYFRALDNSTILSFKDESNIKKGHALVLHLHGSIGWYYWQPDGRPIYHGDSGSYDPNVGTPIIMLPDPDKSYESKDIINQIWQEFIKILTRARQVLILGHSLNDDRLVEELKNNIDQKNTITVAIPANWPDPSVSGTGNRDIEYFLKQLMNPDSNEPRDSSFKSAMDFIDTVRAKLPGVAVRGIYMFGNSNAKPVNSKSNTYPFLDIINSSTV